MFGNYTDYKNACLEDRLKFWAETYSWKNRIALDGNTTITRLDMLDDLRTACHQARLRIINSAPRL